MYVSYRLLSFETNDQTNVSTTDEDTQRQQKTFSIKMYGVNEKGKTACINVRNYTPFFYIKVGDEWGEEEKIRFITQVKSDIGEQYADDIVKANLVQRKKLYGFDGGKQYNFVQLKFKNEIEDEGNYMDAEEAGLTFN